MNADCERRDKAKVLFAYVDKWQAPQKGIAQHGKRPHLRHDS
jgi:hypothetical protein